MLTSLGGVLLVVRDRAYMMSHPPDGVRMSFDWHDPPPLRKIRRLDGSFALQTGGRLQVVTIDNIGQRPNGAVDDATLKSLGVTVRMTHTAREAPPQSGPVTFAAAGEPRRRARCTSVCRHQRRPSRHAT